MWKYFKAIIKAGFQILFNYPRIVYYHKHMDKIPYEKRRKFGYYFYRLVTRAFNVKVNFDGREKVPEGPVVFVSNHQSFYDPMISEAIDKPVVYIAKKEIAKFPFAGHVSTFLESIYIDRENVREAVRVVKEAVKKIEEGKCVWVFPEGTRSKKADHTMNEFRPGALKIAYLAKATIVPCAFCGAWEIFSKKVHKKEYNIEFKFFDPISYDEYKQFSTTELAVKLQNLIEPEVNRMLKNYIPA